MQGHMSIIRQNAVAAAKSAKERNQPYEIWTASELSLLEAGKLDEYLPTYIGYSFPGWQVLVTGVDIDVLRAFAQKQKAKDENVWVSLTTTKGLYAVWTRLSA